MIYIISPDRLLSGKEICEIELIYRDFKPYIYAFQLRIKDEALALVQLKNLNSLSFRSEMEIIMNDFIHLAKENLVEGFHFGEGDLDLEKCRDILGSNLKIGVSCYGSLDRAALNAKAAYVSFGCFYTSNTKINPVAIPDLSILTQWKNSVHPTKSVCIGGLDDNNFMALLTAGADIAAFSSYVWQGNSPYRQIKKLVDMLKGSEGSGG